MSFQLKQEVEFKCLPHASVIKCSAILLSSLLLMGCGNTPDLADYRQQFLTKVTDDDSKWFSYTLNPIGNWNKAVNRYRNDAISGKDVRRKNKSNDRATQKRIDTGRFDQLLNQYVNQSGFCREGYIELDSRETERTFFFMGECKESATADDKQKWPNNDRFDEELGL